MLDPQNEGEWAELRALAHRIVDDLIDHSRDIRERRVWRAMDSKSRAALKAPIPKEGQGLKKTYEDYLSHIRPFPTGNAHPRFFGWMMGGGTLSGALATLLAAGANINAFGGHQAATLVEQQVLDYFRALFSMPPKSSGLFLSGASMANLIALAVAKRAKHSEGRSLIYCSWQTHVSINKAATLLGLEEAIRQIDCDAQGRIDVAALAEALSSDVKAGLRPMCLIGNAGTINTGAVDDLSALAELAKAHEAWLHIDGAVGAVAMISPSLQPKFLGIERADSVAFDLHKWLQLPYEAGCLLVRDRTEHRKTFSKGSAYLARMPGGLGGSKDWFNQLGPELSRSFRALKVWFSLKTHGTQKFSEMIETRVALTAQLAKAVDAHPSLQRLCEPQLCILCFRYIAPLSEDALDALNTKIAVTLCERGIAVVSLTRLNGKTALRCALSNHRTNPEDVRALIEACAQIGRALNMKSG